MPRMLRENLNNFEIADAAQISAFFWRGEEQQNGRSCLLFLLKRSLKLIKEREWNASDIAQQQQRADRERNHSRVLPASQQRRLV